VLTFAKVGKTVGTVHKSRQEHPTYISSTSLPYTHSKKKKKKSSLNVLDKAVKIKFDP